MKKIEKEFLIRWGNFEKLKDDFMLCWNIYAKGGVQIYCELRKNISNKEYKYKAEPGSYILYLWWNSFETNNKESTLSQNTIILIYCKTKRYAIRRQKQLIKQIENARKQWIDAFNKIGSNKLNGYTQIKI